MSAQPDIRGRSDPQVQEDRQIQAYLPDHSTGEPPFQGDSQYTRPGSRMDFSPPYAEAHLRTEGELGELEKCTAYGGTCGPTCSHHGHRQPREDQPFPARDPCRLGKCDPVSIRRDQDAKDREPPDRGPGNPAKFTETEPSTCSSPEDEDRGL